VNFLYRLPSPLILPSYKVSFSSRWRTRHCGGNFSEIRHTGVKKRMARIIYHLVVKSPLTFVHPETNWHIKLPPSHILKIRVNIIVTAIPRYFKFSLSHKFLSKILWVLLLYSCRMPCLYSEPKTETIIFLISLRVDFQQCTRIYCALITAGQSFSDTNFILLPGETRIFVLQTTECTG
jgi:hypothetical protein